MQHIQPVMDKTRTPDTGIFQAAPVSALPKPDTETLWSRLAKVSPDARRLRENRIVTFDDLDPAAEAFDMLRTRAIQKMRQNGWTSVAITSPSAGCGNSLVALNLALSMARQEDSRTLLVDLNLRSPQVAPLLGIESARSIEAMLRGHCAIERAVLRCGENLALATNGIAAERPAELLQSARTLRSLEKLTRSLAPDLTIYDMPAMRPHDDTISFLRHVDCAILVVEAERTKAEEVDLCEVELSEATALLGVVLNKCRYMADALAR